MREDEKLSRLLDVPRRILEDHVLEIVGGEMEGHAAGDFQKDVACSVMAARGEADQRIMLQFRWRWAVRGLRLRLTDFMVLTDPKVCTAGSKILQVEVFLQVKEVPSFGNNRFYAGTGAKFR
ncbi:unnamed protein product [Vicia faba]|uniref:Uncharacterized protein n=1 Tax=Vicia faba TaxID=3906 RepID=A0AAV0ZE34_VICFA|nr:unnamed protein product [Vicia faba]